MATIFPGSASAGQIFDGYEFNGTAWDIIGIDITQDYPVMTSGKISESAVPLTIPRNESPTFTGTVSLPQNTSIGNVTHSEIMSLSGISGSIQVQIDGKTTASYVDAAISNALSGVIDTAPSTLNTLNELAAALGDDPNFATTITELIAAKMTSVPGVINQFAGSGSAAPTGWLFCDGQEVLITTYQSLYNSLTSNGTVFPYGSNTNGSGGAGSTHFRIPNFKGKVPVGKDSAQTEFDVLGETGGSKTSVASHTHGIDHDHGAFNAGSGGENASHSHGFDLNIVHSDGAPVYGEILNVGIYLGNGVSRYSDGTGGISNGHSHTTTIDVPNFTGTSGAASTAVTSGNLQPYIVVNYIIKT